MFLGGKSCVILDFMSKIRFVFDSYLESSIKSGERLRRAGGVGSVVRIEITKDVPIPHQLDKVWASPTNKIQLQQLARRLASTSELAKLTVVLSGCITDEAVVPAHMLHAGRASTPLSENAVSIEALTCDVEEQDIISDLRRT